MRSKLETMLLWVALAILVLAVGWVLGTGAWFLWLALQLAVEGIW